jgi:hypothetical protein
MVARQGVGQTWSKDAVKSGKWLEWVNGEKPFAKNIRVLYRLGSMRLSWSMPADHRRRHELQKLEQGQSAHE